MSVEAKATRRGTISAARAMREVRVLGTRSSEHGPVVSRGERRPGSCEPGAWIDFETWSTHFKGELGVPGLTWFNISQPFFGAESGFHRDILWTVLDLSPVLNSR